MFIYTRQGRCPWTWCLVLAGAGASKAVAVGDTTGALLGVAVRHDDDGECG
jgi:hypothetical protein